MKNNSVTWYNINVETFKEIYSIREKEFNSEDERSIEILSIILDQPIEYFEELEYSEFEKLLIDLSHLKQFPTRPPRNDVETSAGKLYLFNDLNKITLGEFIDLENYFVEGYIKNLNLILAILYRQKNILNSPLYMDTFEEYGNWIFHRQPLFNNIPIEFVYGVIPMYLKFRTNIYEVYSGLFNDVDDNSNSEANKVEIEKMSHSERIEYRKAIEEEESKARWNFDVILYKLAGNNPLKLEQATQLSLIQALNTLSMVKELKID